MRTDHPYTVLTGTGRWKADPTTITVNAPAGHTADHTLDPEARTLVIRLTAR